MAINYTLNDDLLLDWQPHLHEQSLDGVLDTYELLDPYPDIYDMPSFQGLGRVTAATGVAAVGDENPFNVGDDNPSEATVEYGVLSSPRDGVVHATEDTPKSTAESGGSSSSTAYCHCCNEIAELRR